MATSRACKVKLKKRIKSVRAQGLLLQSSEVSLSLKQEASSKQQAASRARIRENVSKPQQQQQPLQNSLLLSHPHSLPFKLLSSPSHQKEIQVPFLIIIFIIISHFLAHQNLSWCYYQSRSRLPRTPSLGLRLFSSPLLYQNPRR